MTSLSSDPKGVHQSRDSNTDYATESKPRKVLWFVHNGRNDILHKFEEGRERHFDSSEGGAPVSWHMDLSDLLSCEIKYPETESRERKKGEHRYGRDDGRGGSRQHDSEPRR
jgi:hypothetical protein